MARVTRTIDIDVSADAAWELFGDFNGLPGWLDIVASSETEGSGVGAVRTLALPDGGKVIEEQEARDDAGHSYGYTILDSPLPLANYHATLKVTATGDGSCSVEWSGSFDAPEGMTEEPGTEVLEGLYTGGLASAKAKLEG